MLTRMMDDTTAMWDREAAAFDDAPDHGLRDPAVRRAWSELLLPLVGGPRRRVADLGCGTGTLSALLAVEGGHVVHGVDISPEMIERARAKTEQVVPRPVFTVADASDPPLRSRSFDVVLCRHVLWALPDRDSALRRWVDLLAPGGALILIEGRWSTGAGMTAAECTDLVRSLRDTVEIRMLDDAAYWGGPTDDERYVIYCPGVPGDVAGVAGVGGRR